MRRFILRPFQFASRFLRRPAFALAGWALAIGAGFYGLAEYGLRAGPDARETAQWPSHAGLSFDPTRANLVMFAHPQCPCSRASVAELAMIMTRCAGELRAVVCFSDPDEESAPWTQSSLWRAAAAIPGVEVVADVNGRVAARFSSATSGQVFLFDREGDTIFSGGITGARGHEGENRGRNFVIALARGEMCAASTTPVFGCSLSEAPLALANHHP
jgi:hypothetical protein